MNSVPEVNFSPVTNIISKTIYYAHLNRFTMQISNTNLNNSHKVVYNHNKECYFQESPFTYKTVLELTEFVCE